MYGLTNNNYNLFGSEKKMLIVSIDFELRRSTLTKRFYNGYIIIIIIITFLFFFILVTNYIFWLIGSNYVVTPSAFQYSCLK